MNRDEQFFYDHAGFGYDPKTQTADEGRTECAKQLAAAELAFMRCPGAACGWFDDDSSAAELRRERERFKTCEYAVLTINGENVTSLHAITDATDAYRRVVRAELALEVIDQLTA